MCAEKQRLVLNDCQPVRLMSRWTGRLVARGNEVVVSIMMTI